MGLSVFELSWLLNWLLNGIKMPWYSVFMAFCIFLLLFRTNGKIERITADQSDFRLSYGNYLKEPFWKLLDICYVQSFFSTTMIHIENGIWVTHYSWRFYGHESTYVLIVSWVSIIKRKWAKVPGKLSVWQKSKPALQRTLHQDISFIIAFFFFAQTNLVFKFNLVLIE